MAASVIRSMVHGGFEHDLDLGGGHALDAAGPVTHLPGQGLGRRARRRRERHPDPDLAVGVHQHVVDQPEFVDVHRDLGVEHLLQRGDDPGPEFRHLHGVGRHVERHAELVGHLGGLAGVVGNHGKHPRGKRHGVTRSRRRPTRRRARRAPCARPGSRT